MSISAAAVICADFEPLQSIALSSQNSHTYSEVAPPTTWLFPKSNSLPFGDVAKCNSTTCFTCIAVAGVCIPVGPSIISCLLCYSFSTLNKRPLHFHVRFIKKPSICVHMYLLLPESENESWLRVLFRMDR